MSVPAAARAPPEGTRSCHRKHHGRASGAPPGHRPGTAQPVARPGFGAAFLGVRMAAYKQASAAVMAVLRARYPLVEQVSINEAYIDLAAGAGPGLATG